MLLNERRRNGAKQMPDGDRNANVKGIGGGVFSKLLATVSGQNQTSDCACAIATASRS